MPSSGPVSTPTARGKSVTKLSEIFESVITRLEDAQILDDIDDVVPGAQLVTSSGNEMKSADKQELGKLKKGLDSKGLV